jgi:hypothetical protein
MPATTIATSARSSTSRLCSSLCNPATPTSYTRSTATPSIRSVSAHSSATGRSPVPAVSSATGRLPSGAMAMRSHVATRAISTYFRPGTAAVTSRAASEARRVTSTFCSRRKISRAMPMICSGVLPAARITSAAPWRRARW